MGVGVAGDFAASLAGLRVCVAGLGVSGPPAARALAARGATVTAVDARDDDARRSLARELAGAGVRVLLGPDATRSVPPETGLVVTSPGWRPDQPLLAAAAAGGIEVIGDVELAWRLRPVRPDGTRQPWLAVTGTNGKTTTVRMLAAMLRAAGLRAAEAGNVGTPVIELVSAADPPEVLAVELSSFQLHWSSTLRPVAAAILNIAAHHLDWHGDIDAYTAEKAKIFAPGTIAIGNADDPRSAALAQAVLAQAGPAQAGPGTRRVVRFRLGEPGPGELGVSGGYLVDRAFGDGDVRLAAVTGIGAGHGGAGHGGANYGGAGHGSEAVAAARPPAPHVIANALAAAALARAYGVGAAAVASALAGFRPDPHRIALVGTVGGVDFVDDSKASNPHAAAASLAAFDSVVWIAGGQFKGADADLDALVTRAAPRLRGVVLLGADRDRVARALARHAPQVPVVEAAGTDTGVMDIVVAKAAGLAVPGDTVLLAPAAQSFDIFRDYPARGEAFAAAVGRLAAGR
ncbi:MAG: Mur ligase family protein [Streptosporangiaceae bacterium]